MQNDGMIPPFSRKRDDPLGESTYERRVLLCVTGLSPQVVTETVFALAQRSPPWIPTEVHVLTTVTGAKRARLLLLAPDRNQFGRLLDDYSLPGIHFDEASVHVVTDAEGRPLDDIRTQADNLAVADDILRTIAGLARDGDCAIHVSLAGGRKSMGFFAGYALSLCARPQDHLSHVLVSPEFESNPEFFFPPRTPRVLLSRDMEPISTADAKVELADIPFVRLRDRVPQALSEDGRFVEVVQAAQRVSDAPTLRVLVAERAIECAGQRIDLSPMRFAVYAWHAWRAAHLDHPEVSRAEFDAVASALRTELREFGNRLFPNAFSAEHEEWNARPWSDDAAGHGQWLSEQRTRTNESLCKALGEAGERVYGIRKLSLGGRRSAHRLDLVAQAIQWKDA